MKISGHKTRWTCAGRPDVSGAFHTTFCATRINSAGYGGARVMEISTRVVSRDDSLRS